MSSKLNKTEDKNHNKTAGGVNATPCHNNKTAGGKDKTAYKKNKATKINRYKTKKVKRDKRADNKRNNNTLSTDKIGYYFRTERLTLLLVTLSGLIYNVGLIATPWFEGMLAQSLSDVLKGEQTANFIATLVLYYIAVTLIVQGARFVKRFYVRRFSNNVNRTMKGVLYANLLRQDRAELAKEGAGKLLTEAISDVDDCAEGMRKFTTEIFDTGIALIAYAVTLFIYDWRLTLICLAFLPISYFCAVAMKKTVQKAGSACKNIADKLSSATIDRAQNALTYRIYGCEKVKENNYEELLNKYEKTATLSNVWQSALPPLYSAISSMGVIFILWLGAKNVLGVGWSQFTVASITTYLSCYLKLTVKSSKVAKLFNSVQKAEVSWKRIKPLLKTPKPIEELKINSPDKLYIKNLSCSYGDKIVFEGLSVTLTPGDIVGVTGAVASGKSTFGKAFLCESPYNGSIRFKNKELSTLGQRELAQTVGYLGHDTELFSDTIKNNVLLGVDEDPLKFLEFSAFSEEAVNFENGLDTEIGSEATRLSGGQAQRLALARTLAHPRPIMILDDPFSALDRKTEDVIFKNLKEYAKDKIVIIISHRLYHFPEMNKVIFLCDKKATVASHDKLMKENSVYRKLYLSQTEGGLDEKN